MDMTKSTGRAQREVMLYPGAAESSEVQNLCDDSVKSGNVEPQSTSGEASGNSMTVEPVTATAFPSPTGAGRAVTSGDARALSPSSIHSTADSGTSEEAAVPPTITTMNQQQGQGGADSPSSSAASSGVTTPTPQADGVDGSVRRRLLPGFTAPVTDGIDGGDSPQAGSGPGSGAGSPPPSPKGTLRAADGHQGPRQGVSGLESPDPGPADVDNIPHGRDKASTLQLALDLAQSTKSAVVQHQGDGHRAPPLTVWQHPAGPHIGSLGFGSSTLPQRGSDSLGHLGASQGTQLQRGSGSLGQPGASQNTLHQRVSDRLGQSGASQSTLPQRVSDSLGHLGASQGTQLQGVGDSLGQPGASQGTQFPRGNGSLGQPGASKGNQAFQGADHMGLVQQYAGASTLPHPQSISGGHPSTSQAPPPPLIGSATRAGHSQGVSRTQTAGVAQLGTQAAGYQQRAVNSSVTGLVSGAQAAQLTATVPGPHPMGPHPPSSPALDQLLAAVQLQIQQTQQVTAQMEQHRRAQEALAGRLDQQMVSQQLMGDILQDLAPTAGRAPETRRAQEANGQAPVRLSSVGDTQVKSYASGMQADQRPVGGRSVPFGSYTSQHSLPTQVSSTLQSAEPYSLAQQPVGSGGSNAMGGFLESSVTRMAPSHISEGGPLGSSGPAHTTYPSQGDSSRCYTAPVGQQYEQPGMPQNQHLPRPYVPKHLMPKPFDGTGNWSEFLVQFNVCSQLGQWTDFVKAQTLGGLMAGKALTTYCAIPERDRVAFGNLVSALTLKFQDRQNVARAKLESRVRNANEKVQDLASDIWNLTSRAYPDFPLEYREQIGLEAFKRAVDVQLRLRLADFKATSLDEAVNIIEQYESIMAADAQQKRRYNARTTAAKPLSAPDSGGDAILKKLDQLASHLKQLVGAPQTQAQISTQQPTQGSSVAPPATARPEQSSQDGNRFPRRQGAMGGSRGCFICGANGENFHMSRNCPQRQGNGQPSAY